MYIIINIFEIIVDLILSLCAGEDEEIDGK